MLEGITIIDCTIRDGGHLNNWNFDTSLVRSAYSAAQRAGVNYFEIGYRYPPEREDLGPFAVCMDEFLFDNFKHSDSCKLAVMIDAGKCRVDDFADCVSSKTLIQAVRVAAYPYELKKAFSQIEVLHNKGYEVFLNLMAASELTQNEFALLDKWGDKKNVSALSFADSFGSFFPDQISKTVDRLKKLEFNRLGFHSHNNLEMAFANVLRAIDEGVEVIDASIFGMGRGSGNLPIEVFVGYLERIWGRRYNTVPYLDVIQKNFIRMRDEFGWGYGLSGMISGLSNVHPYYINKLIGSGLYTIDEVWDAASIIKKNCPISYSVEELSNTLNKRFVTPLEQEEADNLLSILAEQIHMQPAVDSYLVPEFALENHHSGRVFLIIANGPTVLEDREEIVDFINSRHCVTIGMNNLGGLFEPDYHIFVSRKRFQRYANTVSSHSQLILPSFFGERFITSITDKGYVFFNISAPYDENLMPILGAMQNCSHLNVAISAILAAVQMGASEIYVVGMDGYHGGSDHRIRYFYDEDDRVERSEVASLRYELLASELGRVSAWLEQLKIPFGILTETSHKKYHVSGGLGSRE